ncbi:MAG: tetratricopeptide repeat protein [Alphaproteobacteria bacterium]|nr:tetratricopeptide repeat protein [Alphaproteobacteria bacterium]MDE1988048.1 tetratricopeptide repeat protein [Alphaproteobacteria bacterium]MDE2162814.1 tetratricopeptide repeat protein [Alphaproteobacteria bacterium]MDE2266359.1 tetratricopeptide repeat protein [Alphaproteobacteria bacterium]
MSDIFREVEEDVRRERLEKLWKQYGDYIIAGVAAIVVGVAGFKLWQHYEAEQQLKASTTYAQAMQLSESGKDAEAAQLFAQISKSAPSGYASAAKLSQADALLAGGKTAQAVAIYKAIAGNDSSALGEVARIRAAWAMADTASKSELQTLLAPLTDQKSAWRFMAQEILAYCDFREGKLKEAESEYESLAAEPTAPDTLRQRAIAMSSFIRTGGGANYGTVPPPAAPADAGVQKGNTSQ